jgi:hypothetical protein
MDDPRLEAAIADVINTKLENGADFVNPNGGGGYIESGAQDGNRFFTPTIDDEGRYFEVTVRCCKDVP